MAIRTTTSKHLLFLLDERLTHVVTNNTGFQDKDLPVKYTEHVALNEFTEEAYGHAAKGVLGIILHSTATDIYWEKSSTAAIFFDPERALNHRPVNGCLLIIAIYSNQNMHFCLMR